MECRCGCGKIIYYGRFVQGHSVQNRRKMFRKMHLPLGKKRRKKLLRKEKKEAKKKGLLRNVKFDKWERI